MSYASWTFITVSGLLCYPSAVVVVRSMGVDWRNEPVLLDLVKQRAITNAEQPRGGFAVPVGLFQGVGDSTTLSLAFGVPYQHLQRRLFLTGRMAVLPVVVSVSVAIPVPRCGVRM